MCLERRRGHNCVQKCDQQVPTELELCKYCYLSHQVCVSTGVSICIAHVFVSLSLQSYIIAQKLLLCYSEINFLPKIDLV